MKRYRLKEWHITEWAAGHYMDTQWSNETEEGQTLNTTT